MAKDPFDKPGKTSAPEVTDWDKDHADLQWNPPVNDGGAPIEGYVVEMKEKHSPFWTEAVQVGLLHAAFSGTQWKWSRPPAETK